MRENAGKMRTRITSNRDTFYAVMYAVSGKKFSMMFCVYEKKNVREDLVELNFEV